MALYRRITHRLLQEVITQSNQIDLTFFHSSGSAKLLCPFLDNSDGTTTDATFPILAARILNVELEQIKVLDIENKTNNSAGDNSESSI